MSSTESGPGRRRAAPEPRQPRRPRWAAIAYVLWRQGLDVESVSRALQELGHAATPRAVEQLVNELYAQQLVRRCGEGR